MLQADRGRLGLLKVDERFWDLNEAPPWWLLGFTCKALLEDGVFTYLPAVLLD